MESSSLGAIAQPLQPVVSLHRRSADAGAKPEAQDKSTRPEPLSADETAKLQKLQQRDREVRAHELAHKSVAGQYARGAARFTYELGPDNRRYAIGGEVSIDIAKEADPEKTLQKALVVKRAAQAPADPSAQDRQIAMQATRMAAEARQEIARQREADRAGDASTDPGRTSLSGESDRQGPDRDAASSDPKTQRAIAAFIATSVLDQLPSASPIDSFI